MICGSWLSEARKFWVELRLALVVGPCPPLSSVVSPPHSVGGLSRSRPLPGGLWRQSGRSGPGPSRSSCRCRPFR